MASPEQSQKSSNFYAALVEDDDDSVVGDNDALSTTPSADGSNRTQSLTSNSVLRLDNSDNEEDNEDDLPLEFSYTSETKEFMKNMFLISMQILFELIPSVLVTIMVGHYYDGVSKDDEYISAVGLATTFIMVAGDSVVWGLTTALYTLVPQATGAADPDKPILEQIVVKNALAVHLQRSFIVTIVSAIPCAILQCFSGRLMTLVGEPEYLETYITNFTMTLIPWMFASSIFAAIQRVAQAVDFNVLLFFVTLFGGVISYPIMYVLMYFCDTGYLGPGIALSVSFWLVVIVLVAILCKYGYGFLFDFRAYGWRELLNKEDMKSYLKLSLPGMLQNILEWWIIEVAMILSGFIGKGSNQETISISTAVICYDLYLILYSVALGAGNAVNISVGKYIGANNVPGAKKAGLVGTVVTLVLCLIVALGLILARNDIALLFTHNPETRRTMSYVTYAFVYYSVFLFLSQFFSGLYRGLGQQDKTAKFVLVSDYFVAIPVLIIVLFAGKLKEDLIAGACAIWAALGAGTMLAVIVCIFYMIRKISWSGAAKRSMVEMESMRQLSIRLTPKEAESVGERILVTKTTVLSIRAGADNTLV